MRGRQTFNLAHIFVFLLLGSWISMLQTLSSTPAIFRYILGMDRLFGTQNKRREGCLLLPTSFLVVLINASLDFTVSSWRPQVVLYWWFWVLLYDLYYNSFLSCSVMWSIIDCNTWVGPNSCVLQVLTTFGTALLALQPLQVPGWRCEITSP